MTCPQVLKAYLDAIAGDEKFILTVAIGAVNVPLLSFGYLTGGEYITALGWIFTTYVAGKTVESVATSNSATKVEEARSVARVAEAETK